MEALLISATTEASNFKFGKQLRFWGVRYNNSSSTKLANLYHVTAAEM